MSEFNNGTEAAFAKADTAHGLGTEGLTKREYFAAKAMQGFLARNSATPDYEIAKWSVDLADSLLAALGDPHE